MNQQQETAPASREKTIIRTSIIGIFANLFLAAFKAAVGLLSHSIAIVLDAVNNLSDALSSVITIVGTKLAGKALAEFVQKPHQIFHIVIPPSVTVQNRKIHKRRVRRAVNRSAVLIHGIGPFLKCTANVAAPLLHGGQLIPIRRIQIKEML